MKKRILIKLLILSAIFFLSSSAFASETVSPNNSSELTFSKEAITVTENHYHYHYNSNRHYHYHYYTSYTFGDFIIDIFDILWLFNNLSVEFDSYPYANGKYLYFYDIIEDENTYRIYEDGNYSDDTGDDNSGSNVDINSIPNLNYKSYRYETEMDGFYFINSGNIGLTNRFEGFFWKFFGPIIDNSIYFNVIPMHGMPLEPINGNLKLGMQISIFQSNLLSLSTGFEWSYWYGPYSIHGYSTEFIFRSYPVYPIVLEDRLNVTVGNFKYNYNHHTYPCMIENTFEMSFMIERGSAVSIQYRFYSDEYEELIDHGVALGYKYFF